MIVPPIAPFLGKKAALRLHAAATRRRASLDRPDAAMHAARLFMEIIPLPDRATVALYHPIKDELDVQPLAEALAERGHALALPVAVRKGAPLLFRKHKEGDELRADRHGVPAPSEAAPELSPAIVVVPLLAFDRRGARLGYGGGYYDRTIAKLRKQGGVLAVGYAFGAQEAPALPNGAHDQRLDWIVTEREAIRAQPPEAA